MLRVGFHPIVLIFIGATSALSACADAATNDGGGRASGGANDGGNGQPTSSVGGSGGTGADGGSPAACVPDADGEICDGVDNDCDGAVDASDDSMPTACTGGEGVCLGPGVLSCENGIATCIPDIEPSVELCNTPIDENCDGYGFCSGESVWTRSFGATGESVGGVAVAAGKTAAVVAGAFHGTVDFGVATLAASGPSDILILQVDYAGQPEWAVGAGNADYQDTRDVAVDSANNAVVVGGAQGAVTLGGVTMTAVAGYDPYAAKLSPEGDVLWAQAFPSSNDSFAISVAIAPPGDEIVVAGTYRDSQSFGSIVLPSAINQDAFVTKLAPDGSVVWSRSFNGTGYEACHHVVVDSAGNTLAVGHFTQAIQVGAATLTGGGNAPFFLIKLDPNGEVLWARSYAQYGLDEIWAHVATDLDDNIVFYGSYRGGPIDLGGGPLPPTGTNTNIFVAKLDASGAHQWSKSFSSTGGVYPADVTLDQAGNLLFTGYLVGTGDFGGGPLTADQYPDVLLVKLAPDGTHIWSKAIGADGYQVGYGVAADELGYVTMTGFFQGTVDFGTGPVSAMNEDLFLTRFMP